MRLERIWLRVSAWTAIVLIPWAARAADSESTADRREPRAVAQVPGVVKSRKAATIDAVITPEREAAVLAFVQQHHPELSILLESLKDKNPQEYRRAIRDLFRVSERLDQYHGRDTQRYELELKLWQAQSRLDLLAARWKMSSSDELREQVRQSLEEVYSLRRSLLELERERAAERVRKLDAQLGTLDQSRTEYLERQLEMFSNQARRPGGGQPVTGSATKGKSGKNASPRNSPAKGNGGKDRPAGAEPSRNDPGVKTDGN